MIEDAAKIIVKNSGKNLIIKMTAISLAVKPNIGGSPARDNTTITVVIFSAGLIFAVLMFLMNLISRKLTRRIKVAVIIEYTKKYLAHEDIEMEHKAIIHLE